MDLRPRAKVRSRMSRSATRAAVAGSAGTPEATSGKAASGIVGLEGVEFGPRKPPRLGHWPERIEMWRGISVRPTGSSWQQIAPIEGCSTVGSGR